MNTQQAQIWYVQSEDKENPLQPNRSHTTAMQHMYIREMSQEEKDRFPVKGFKNLYSIHDENGQELGVTDNREVALKLAEKHHMNLNSVH